MQTIQLHLLIKFAQKKSSYVVLDLNKPLTIIVNSNTILYCIFICYMRFLTPFSVLGNTGEHYCSGLKANVASDQDIILLPDDILNLCLMIAVVSAWHYIVIGRRVTIRCMTCLSRH